MLYPPFAQSQHKLCAAKWFSLLFSESLIVSACFFKAEQVVYCGWFGFFAEKKLSAVTENSMQREPKR